MKTLKRTIIALALGATAAGCSLMDTQRDAKPVAREELKNAQGHVIGYKETMRDGSTGEQLAQIALFVPRVGERGEIVGYEERVRGGSVLHDLYGKRVGGRWVDLRSRAGNPTNRGLTIVVVGKASERAAVVAEAPSIDELIRLARLN
jgi:hypothetical protein